VRWTTSWSLMSNYSWICTKSYWNQFILRELFKKWKGNIFQTHCTTVRNILEHGLHVVYTLFQNNSDSSTMCLKNVPFSFFEHGLHVHRLVRHFTYPVTLSCSANTVNCFKSNLDKSCVTKISIMIIKLSWTVDELYSKRLYGILLARRVYSYIT